MRLAVGLFPSARGGGAPAVTPSTWNPADKSARITLSNGNLTAVGDGIGHGTVRATQSKTAARGFSGSATVGTGSGVGIGFCNATQDMTTPGYLSSTTNGVAWYGDGVVYYNESAALGPWTAYSPGDTVFIYYDPATDLLEGFVNGVAAGTASVPGIGATFFAAYVSNNNGVFTADFTVDGPGGRSKYDA